MSGATDETDLQRMWEETQTEYRELAGLKNDGLLEILTIDDVLGKLDEDKIKDEKGKTTKRGRAKDLVRKTLVCVDSLGHIAAQGASIVSEHRQGNGTYLIAWQVFGPSQMCFNAISFIITSAQKYSKIFADILELLERVSVFLERFQIHTRTANIGDGHIDPRLGRLVHQLLQSFMRICIITIKLTHRDHRLLAFGKILLYDSDGGVQNELDKFERLVGDELGMTVALILESSKSTEATVLTGFVETQSMIQGVGSQLGDQVVNVASSVQNLRVVLERTEKEKKSKEIAEVNRVKIRDFFGIKEKEEPWTSTYEKLVATLIPQSGNWLLKNDTTFSDWSKAYIDAKYTIAVEGKDGFGKSCLFAAVVRHLLRLPTTQVSERRSAVAYFFLQSDAQENKDTKEAHGEKQREPLDMALISIIWQLTNKDIAFRKFVAAACNSREEPADIEELWTRLVISHSNIDASFYILLDGIESLDGERTQRLFRIIRRSMDMNNRSQHLRIQWFVTGRPSSFSPSPHMTLEESPIVRKFILGTCNQEDILNFIDISMNEMTALVNKSNDPQKHQLRLTIRERLSEGVCGDFTKLSYKLRDISTKSRVDEIEEVLTHINEDIEVTITRQLKRLNVELDERDVVDLNEMLVWIVAIGSSCPWAVTIPLLEEILSLRDTPQSLVPLQDRIKTTFAPLLEIVSSPYTVELQVGLTASLLEYFEGSSLIEDANVSATSNSLHPSEIAIVKRILQNFCDEDLFRRFEFENYFQQKTTKSKTTINVDISKVHVKIVDTLLMMLCGEHTTKWPHLVQYAIEHLADHLEEDKWASADQETKRNTGRLLVKLFTEERIINQTWTREQSLWAVGYYWIIAESDVRNTLVWFKDPATTLDVSEQHRSWIANLSGNNPSQQVNLLKNVVLVLAKLWLRDPHWWAIEKFRIVHSFLTKVSISFDEDCSLLIASCRSRDQILPITRKTTP